MPSDDPRATGVEGLLPDSADPTATAATEVEVWKARYEQVKAERDILRDDIRFMESAKPVICYECATCKRIYRTEHQIWECRHA
jgi:hypothetical protein